MVLTNGTRLDVADIMAVSITDTRGQSFYAEISDFSPKYLDLKATNELVPNLKYVGPLAGEDEYFIWGNPNVRLRDSKVKVAQYIRDWIQDIHNGPVSWVQYGVNDIDAPDPYPVSDMVVTLLLGDETSSVYLETVIDLLLNEK